MLNLHTLVERYRNEELSFIPIPYRTKIPVIEWKKYQTEKPTQQEIDSWFNGHDTNLAVICGDVSGGLVVLDFDKEELFEKFLVTSRDKLGQDLLEFTLVSKTSRGYHVWLKIVEPVKNMKYPALDIKSNGGYIIAPPSVHPEGADYKFLNPSTAINTIMSLKDIGLDVELPKPTTITSGNPGWVTQALSGVSAGGRNQTAFKLAGYFKNIMPDDITLSLLLDWNKKNQPPLAESEVVRIVKSASSYRPPSSSNAVRQCYTVLETPSVDINVTDSVTDSVTEFNANVIEPSFRKAIENWVKISDGWFTNAELDADLDIRAPQDKANRRQCIKRLKDDGVIEQSKKENKLYRRIDRNARTIDFRGAVNLDPMAIKFPFAIEEMVNIYPKNIIVVAGAPNAGKTAFLLNFVRMNQQEFPINYFSSEMGEQELALRLGKFEGIALDDWCFNAEERVINFADIIHPDDVNIVDFLEIDHDFSEIAEQIRNIYDRLKKGIAIIAIQKNPGAALGRGAGFSLEKARLYLAMDAGVTSITKAKNWVDPELNPNKMKIEYKIVGGCRFIVTKDWYKDAFERD